MSEASEAEEAKLARIDERTKILSQRIIRIEAIVIFEVLLLLLYAFVNFMPK